MNFLGAPISTRSAPGGLALTSSASTFDLRQIPGLLGLYDASVLSSLYQDDALTTPVTASGNVVGGVLDQSGLGRNLLQSTNTKRPLYKATDLGGGPCWVGDGLDDVLSSTAFSTIAQPFSVFFCGQLQSTSTQTPFEGGTSVARVGVVTAIWKFNASINGDSGITADTGVHTCTAKFSGNSSTFRLDGGTATTTNAGTNTTSQFFVCSRSDGTISSSFRMGLVLVTSGAISDENLTQIRSYCRSRWGNP